VSIRFLLLLSAPPLTGVVIGYLLGGRLDGLRTLRIKALWLVWLAAGVQFTQSLAGVRHFVEGTPGVPIVAVVFAIVLTWLGVNLPHWPRTIRVAGIVIVLGAALNGLAIALNGRMPYDPGAAADAGLHPGTETPKNEPAQGHTRLGVLGDTIAVRPLHAVISAGDILIGGGACALVIVAMRRRRQDSPLRTPGEVNHELETPGLDAPDAGDAALHDRRPADRGQLTVI
jgi:hypothetical protein